jgi:hypothetical protein
MLQNQVASGQFDLDVDPADGFGEPEEWAMDKFGPRGGL